MRVKQTIDVSGIPRPLQEALCGWYRAYHHGTREEERLADACLNIAIAPLITSLRKSVYEQPSQDEPQ